MIKEKKENAWERESGRKKFTNIILLPKLEKPKYLNILANMRFMLQLKTITLNINYWKESG